MKSVPLCVHIPPTGLQMTSTHTPITWISVSLIFQLGIAIIHILKMDPAFGMGLVSLSCAPGGGASNSWTILLGGDVNLSLTMTFLSLVLALGNLVQINISYLIVKNEYGVPGYLDIAYFVP